MLLGNKNRGWFSMKHAIESNYKFYKFYKLCDPITTEQRPGALHSSSLK